ncbi:MAG: hemolysin family protein [Candidatus Thermoplasmatota archaeon]
MAIDIASLASEGLILLAFLAASAFFSLSETAMIGVNRIQVKQRAEAGSKRAKLVDQMLDDPETVLSTVLIGNNLVNVGATAFATFVAVGVFGAEGAVYASIVMAILIILFSELLPKTLSVQNPLPIALAIARPLRTVELVLKPLVAGAAGISRLIARLIGVKGAGKAPYITEDEIEMLVRVGVEQGGVERFEQRIITELFDFTETPIERIMTKAADVHFLPRSATLADATRMAAKEGRTRILVADGDFDHVLGFVHIKDLLHFKDEELDRLPVTLLLRSAMNVPHTLMASQLLTQMQREHRSLAVVLDDTGAHVGIVTSEDLLEELVGEMHDEFDAIRPKHSEHPTPA